MFVLEQFLLLASKFLIRYLLTSSWRSPYTYVMSHFIIILIVLDIQKFDHNDLSVDFFEIILTWSGWASWIFIYISFNKFEKFLAIIFSNILSVPFILYSPSGTPTSCMLVSWMGPTGPLGSVHFSLIFFFLFLRLNSHWLFFKFTNSFSACLNL